MSHAPRLRLAVLAMVIASLVAPAAISAADGDGPLILRAGTDQKLETLNPWHSVTVADYEVFTLNYDLLVGFGQNLEPVPGFAESWESSPDGMTHTFKIRPDMKWSDGQPAACEDARWTYQLVLDAVASEAGYIGSGYLEPYLTNAGLKAVECTDELTLVATTEFPTTLLTQAYVPILPKHIWETYTLDQIGNAEAEGFFKNEPPVVGTGPYVAVEWTPGEFIRFERNESYWGTQGAADEVILQTFADGNTMVQALKSGEIDYVRGVGADQFDALASEADVKTVEGFSNGYTYLSFNTRGNAEGYNGSTSALADVAFRDALGFAIDKERLVDATLNGYGVVGTTNVPPYHATWHVEPNTPRTFDIEEAKRRLDAAGYALDGDGKRLDKDGKPIELRLTWPDSEGEIATNAQFIQEWFSELGIGVDAFVTEEGKLLDDLLGPPDGKADWDFYMWGWVGDPDPMSLLSFFTSGQLGGLNDSFFTNERYDELFELQQRATDPAQRKTYIEEMQQIVYDQAPYHILYYDSELHAYRTDRFGGWTNQPPDTGTPLFGFGPIGYTVLTAASEASPEPSAGASAVPSDGASAAPSPSGDGTPASSGGDNTLLIVGVVAVIAVVVGGLLFARRRPASAGPDDDE
ncbi:MAG TPA: ABC transporter substrate-binding protein [Candidatus Limnocylindrales bacterium]|nr:ABC transporter substrate-binding protein [Candidatus Limnocylindrales bacterium]